jgi:hypothetical protein
MVAALTAATLLFQCQHRDAPPTGERGFKLSEAGPLGRPALFLLSALMFLYVACEVGVWNWLPRYLIAQGIEQSRALNILSLGFAPGLAGGTRRGFANPYQDSFGGGDTGVGDTHGGDDLRDASGRRMPRGLARWCFVQVSRWPQCFRRRSRWWATPSRA